MRREFLVRLILGVFLLRGGLCMADQAITHRVTRSPHGTLNMPCENCHTLTSWKPLRVNLEFDHDKTRYPLKGLHQSVTCTECHVSLVFTNVGTKCGDCHADIHKGQLGANCEECHSVKGWQASAATLQSIKNHDNRFPLIGAHATVPCEECHKGAAVSQFQGLSVECVSCHQQDFMVATPNHQALQFPTTCQSCHNMDSWMGVAFDHAKFTGFALTGMHATLACEDCHVNGNYQITTTNCVGCHLKDFNAAQNPNHVQAGFSQNCATCHNTANWTSVTFDHNTFTSFPLTGAHVGVACNQCHINGVFAGTPTDCYSCHLKDFQGTTNPNHVQSGFPTTCQQCHNTTAWTNATFDHSTTGFPLTGAHTTVQCQLCHVNNNYNLTSANTTCVSCHLTDFQGTTNPNHVTSGFPTTCQQCHTTASWANATFDHSTTGFPLTGAHTSLQCQQCHVNNNYNLTSANAACVSCHLADFNGTTNPNHVQSGFAQTCDQCHSTASWLNATFDHNNTGFPLTGAHTTVQCQLCHVNNNYNLTSANTACVSCHLTDFQGTTNPNHVQAGFPTTCQQCHTTAAWTGATFDHSTTGFPLTGAHTTVLCSLCHVNGNYALTTANTACVSCHLTDYNSTTNPNHVQAAFPTTCDQCHTTASWGSATFDHSTTGFPLTGFHTTLTCVQCHVNGNYALTSANTTCISCHQTDYSTTNNPPHVAAGFSTTCQTCHTTTAWTGATFDHSTTGFALTGFHTTLTCVQCHVNNNYSLTTANTACYSCHQTDFTGTTNPAHVAAGFPTDCTICHTTASWTTATFNHSTTGFALVGAHTTLQCAQCHVNNNYSLTTANTACYSCHQTDFTGTTNPAHVAAGFPTDCTPCHGTAPANWLTATFTHPTTPFALTGAHLTVPCTSCHINNVFAGTPTDCYSCHVADYNGTTNPIHSAAPTVFTTTCTTCHTTTNWTSATFNHTWFPENHGNANSVCTTCHTNANDYTVFQCTNCHGQAQTTSEHSGVKSFVWNSVNCYQCHPNGNGG